ncbi:MAG: HNH endonuclease [Actinomycetota bacterium]|nr:HNH endonuclease [Actinomycetota bacterium]
MRETTRKARAEAWYRNMTPKGPCAICDRRPANTRDHIVPLAKGGAHHPDNIQFVCGPCNSAKGPKLMNEMYAQYCGCGQQLYAGRSRHSGLCSKCHPEGANMYPDWDRVQIVARRQTATSTEIERGRP